MYIHSVYNNVKTTGNKHKPIVASENVNTQKLVQGAQAMTGTACRHLAVAFSLTLWLVVGVKKHCKKEQS